MNSELYVQKFLDVGNMESRGMLEPKIYVRDVDNIFIATLSYDKIYKLKLKKKNPYKTLQPNSTLIKKKIPFLDVLTDSTIPANDMTHPSWRPHTTAADSTYTFVIPAIKSSLLLYLLSRLLSSFIVFGCHYSH